MQLGSFTLRPDQEKLLTAIRWAVAELKRDGKPARVLVQAPCGVGKTVLSCAVMRGAIDKGSRWGFIVRGRQLVEQKSARLTQAMIPHSILMDGYDYHQSAVTVCSVDSYRSRVHERASVPAIDPNGWNVDEAHLASSELFLSFIKDADVTIGFTATPIAKDGCGMGGFWQKLVKGPTHKELLAGGLLVPCKVFAETMPDLSQLQIHDGDWSQEKVAEIMDTKELVGDVLRDWKRWGENRPTVGFASSVEHSIGLAHEFNNAGIPSGHVDAETPQEERVRLFAALEAGRLKVLWNFGVLITGVDFPFASCGIFAFATASLTKFLQAAGRLFRPFAGKVDSILIDHGGNVHRHGWPQEDRDWTLDPEKKIQDLDVERREREKTPREPICCPKCGAMRQSGPKCISCGHQHVKTGIKVKFRDGTIGPYKPKKKPKQQTDAQKVWMQVLGVAAYRGMTCAQASVLFKRKCGDWPEKAGVSPVPDWAKRGVLVRNLYPGFVRKRKETAPTATDASNSTPHD